MKIGLALFGSTLVIAAMVASVCHFRHPTDSAMLSIFRSNQSQLTTTLGRMGNWENAPIGELRSPIATDLVATGARSINKWSDHAVAFYYSVHPGSIKGIVFWPANERPKDGKSIVHNLDESPKTSGIYLKPINDDWCIFLYIMD